MLVVALVGVVQYVIHQRVSGGTLRLSRADWRALTADGLELGASGGKVTIVEFVDYQCPVCARVEPLLDDLEQQFPNQIRRVVRHFPIESIHPQAMRSAKSVECARNQDATRRMHQLLFSAQALLNTIAFDTLGKTIGVPDTSAFRDCVNRGVHSRIQRDVDLANSIGVSGTPTVIVDGLLVTSFSPALLRSLVKSKVD